MATANLNEPTSASDGNIPYIGGTADDGTGNTLREAIDRINARLREIYGGQDGSNVVQTPFIDADNIKDGVITEAKLDISNAAVNGYILSWNNTAGQFEWKEEFDGDITSIIAGDGLTGSSLDTDDATLNIGAGDGITVNADDVALASSVAGAGLSYASGVLSVDAINTDGIANNAVTPEKVNLLADDLAATDGHIMVADGTDFSNVAVSGDATITNTGALTIAADAVDYDKLAGEFTSASALTAATDLDVDFSTAAVFTTTSSIAMDLNFTNAEIGQVKTIVVTDSGGTSSLTFDTATNTVVNINGTYSATAGAVNYIQAQCIAANSFILTISQAA